MSNYPRDVQQHRDAFKKFYFNLRVKDDQDSIAPHFMYKYNDQLSTPSKLGGRCVGIQFTDREQELNGKKTTKRNVTITLQDKDNLYLIRGDFTNLMRSILNSLASQEELGDLLISVYAKAGTNQQMYARAYVTNNKKETQWALSIEEQKKLTRAIKDPVTDETIKVDYSSLDKKLEELVSAVKTQDIEEYTEPEIKDNAKEEEIDDLPF